MITQITRALEALGYKILSDVKTDSFGRFHGEITGNDNKRFFIKAATNRNKYAYYSLLREASVTKYLGEITNNKPLIYKNYRLIIPKVESIINTKHYVCIISELVTAKKLIDQSSHVQAEILLSTLELVNLLGSVAKRDLLGKNLKNYSTTNLILTVPIRALKAIFLAPKLTLKLLLTALKTKNLLTTSKREGLVHADLNASNIFYNSNTIYLVDWEESGWGHLAYNIIAPLTVHWTDEMLRQKLLEKLEISRPVLISFLTYRTLILFNQKVPASDPRRIRDMLLLNYVLNQK